MNDEWKISTCIVYISIEIELRKFTISTCCFAPRPNTVVKPLPGLCILLKQSVTEKVVEWAGKFKRNVDSSKAGEWLWEYRF